MTLYKKTLVVNFLIGTFPMAYRDSTLSALILASIVFLSAYSSPAAATITASMPSPVAHQPNLATGEAGGNGNNADCTKAASDEGKPNDGGTGKSGGSHNKTYTGSISSQDYGTGIIYNSTGGKGGNGGSGSNCYGGRGGGQGGAGGNLTAIYGSGGTNNPVMSVPGSGIIATSQGGNGGKGGGTSNFNDAGNGGVGGNGGPVWLQNNASTISTTNSHAFGMYALSMGGNGGVGGSNGNDITGSGGNGAKGGLGGKVTLYNYGTISTTKSYNMLGISVGGYGGNSGSESGFVPSPSGASGGGGPGGHVSIYNYGYLTTNGVGQASAVALSVGGGGGDAGRSSSLVALGNTGGQGANGGVLYLLNSGTIQTIQVQSIGLAAIGIGGGGGTGGMASGSLIGGGGSGGGGGNGATITAVNFGAICTGGGCSTTLANTAGGVAPAIAAVSVGGGGGVGGYAISESPSASIAIGGNGGNGGSGGEVLVANTNILRTTEISSPAIFAASIGGGGGNGGGSFSVSASVNSTFSMAVGGSGGSGGDGGKVGVNCGQSGSNATSNSACSGTSLGSASSGSSIVTFGSNSPGIVGVSVGGGGGWGGMAVSVAASAGFDGSISIGGKGGSGGAGGSVYAATGGVTTLTYGDLSTGLMAMSVGGGGGHGGTTFNTNNYVPGGAVGVASVNFSVGGSGGSGGAGAATMAENLGGIINTNGDRGSGIFAASIGGRGGHGGLAAGGAVGLAFSANSSVGGHGGNGNTGGTVNVYNTNTSAVATIITRGADSHGIEALSVGGGGGSGGWSAGAGVSIGPSTAITVGGTGGSGGNGGKVNVSNTGTIQVWGRGGAGIFAGSVGGGGGNGGSSASGDVSLTGAFSSTVGGSGTGGASGGTVSVTNWGSVLAGASTYTNPTDPARASQGILAMSVGGGGGRGGLSVGGDLTATISSVSMNDVVGGGSGNGGTGLGVTVYNYGTVESFGDLSNAVTASSIGGRGGMGGIAIGGSVSTGTPMGMTLGGNGGNGGSGGEVLVYNYGTISSGGFTAPGSSIIVGGFRAMGLVAQSMGGHGGMGGIAIGASIGPPLSASASLNLGGSGGGGGKSGPVYAYSEIGTNITTNGPFAAGMVAQSLGGNGGIGGLGLGASTTIVSPSMTLGGNGGDGAIGGIATATNNGTIATQGLHSIGMLAQSIGGNGGMSGVTLAVGSADRVAQAGIALGNTAGTGGSASSATANMNGTIKTEGLLSSGVAAESIGGGGGRAGVAFDLSVASLTDPVYHTVKIGAQGGAGGYGGMANINVLGSITTTGLQSDSVYAGSIGGGGGSSGLSFLNLSLGSKTFNLAAGGVKGAAGNGSTVSVIVNPFISEWDQSKIVQSNGAFSHAIFAQSVGGGGGSATGLHTQPTASGLAQGLLSLGGTGSASGNGGTVNITTAGQVFTNGYASVGIFGQSIGGGGGQTLAGLIVATTTLNIPDTSIQLTAGSQSASSSNGSSGSSTSKPSTNLSLTGSTSTSLGSASSMSLGGFSSSRADSGAVNITASSSIVTSGLMSDGIKAQSVASGGGFAGFADIYSGSPFAASTVTLGGGNSGGGYGGNVTVNSSGTLYTEGSLSIGILAQSLSSGGDARHVSLGAARTAFAVVHGLKAGATGDDGGFVTVNNTAYISTYGYGSDAIVAQSIGGGGGMSGLFGATTTAPSFGPNGTSAGAQAGVVDPINSGNEAYAGAPSGQNNGGAAVSTVTGMTMAAMLGSSGGSGASANDVNVMSNAYLFTGAVAGIGPGDGSAGIIGQAIGGGGGVTRQHTINFDQSQISMGLTLGAMNNANGNGDVVNITNNTASWASAASITTAGQGSMAILAQSIGGGGGLGLLTAGTIGTGGSAAIAMVLGSNGTASGHSEPVTVNSAGVIITTGAQAQGIVAQSIGDGGGVGKAAVYAAIPGADRGTSGNSAYADSSRTYAYSTSGLHTGIRLGSQSSIGSNGYNVTVNSNSTISTSGVRSTAIVAQSISGGGGLVDITAYALNSGDLNAHVILGGGASASSEAVNVTSGGNISTNGALADGILAQAITAGGGSFGLAQTGTTSTGSGNVQFILGASVQSATTNSAPVEVITNATVATTGFGSTAITAQSIGGGGGLLSYITSADTTNPNVSGTLGNASGHYSNGGTVSVTANAYVSTTGVFAHGVVAQSIGGGGGRIVGTAASTNVNLGSSNYGGDGGAVTVTHSNWINTTGSYSHGIVAQSIGVGGGIVDIQGTDVRFGSPSSSGTASTVTINANNQIATFGYASAGIIAQSIAGGGGLAVASGAVTFGASMNSAGSNPNTVNVNVNGPIYTYNSSSPGVVAMSGGGGSGLAFVNSVNQSVTKIKSSGNGGNVNVTVNQPINTYGNISYGVMAGSYGGGGGILIGNDNVVSVTGTGAGSGGTVNVNNQSNIHVYGSYSTAVWMVSANGADDPELTNSGSIMGGPGGVGAYLGGAINNLYNSGSLGTFDGSNGMALITDLGVTQVQNSGVFTGSMKLGAGPNVFNNLPSGLVVGGPILDLSTTGTFNNSGVLQSGGGVAGSTRVLTGDFNQTQDGLTQINFDATGQASQFIINGNANIAGKLGVIYAKDVIIKQGRFANASVISVNGQLTNAGLSSANTAMVRSNTTQNGNQIGLSGYVNFSPAGLSGQTARFSQALANYQDQGSSALINSIVHDLVLVENVDTLNRYYNDLSGSSLSALVQTGIETAQGAMMSYAEQSDQWRRNAPRSDDNRSRLWFSPFAAYSNVGASTGRMTANDFGASGGVDLQVSPNFLVGLGVTGSQNNVNVNSSSMGASQGAGGLGLYGMAKFGQAYLSGSSYVGLDHTSFTRNFMNAGSGSGSLDATLAGLRFEVGYTIPMSQINVTPFATFEPTWRSQRSATETISYKGKSGYGLNFLSQTTKSLPLILGVQLDTNAVLQNNHAVKAFIRAGWVHEFNPNRDLSMSLPGVTDATFSSGGNYAFSNSAVVRIGAQYKVNEQMSFFADINSQFAPQGFTLGGLIGIQMRW